MASVWKRIRPGRARLCSMAKILPTVLLMATFSAGCPWTTGRRDKLQEATDTITALRTAELAYVAETDGFFSLPRCPEGDPGKTPTSFSAACREAWAVAGWLPDGPLRCRYRALALPPLSSKKNDFEIVGECDVDGDGRYAIFKATLSSPVYRTTPADIH